MKTIITLISVLFAVSSAQANDEMRREYPILRCQLDSDVVDYQMIVEVKKVVRSQFKVATISEIGFSGRKMVRGNYFVTERQARTFGAPRVYEGKNFYLAVHQVIRTREDGMVPAILNAVDENGYVIERSMLCQRLVQMLN